VVEQRAIHNNKEKKEKLTKKTTTMVCREIEKGLV